jgi:carboxyl-terminal processing protease
METERMQPAFVQAARETGHPLTARAARLLAALVMALVLAAHAPAAAQEAARDGTEAASGSARLDFGRLFDAVVERISKSFWDKERLAAVGWPKLAADARPGVVEAQSLEEAARRINALLGKLKMSHTGLLTPDDVDYYVLLSVFGGSTLPREEVDERFWGAGVTYAGIGIFSARIEGRDFVDLMLEGSPAERAGMKVGDEIVSVDEAPYHAIRSFRGKVGSIARIAIRREKGGPVTTLPVKVMTIAPLHAFREATLASARVIERDGRRIGYVHVWASVGDESSRALRGALSRLGAGDSTYYPQAEKEKRKPLDGLIVDMRGKIGGTATSAGRYLDLLDPRGPLLGSRGTSRVSRALTSLRGRTAVLIDRHTRSTGELFVHAYRRERQGPLIGTRTAGAVSAAQAFAMPGGNLLYVAVSGLEVDGDVLEGPGVAPDIEVARPLPYAQGADAVLGAAVEYLAGPARLRAAPQHERPSGN